MEYVSLPKAFVQELFEYFYTQLPMKQSELVVQELRRALAQQEQTPHQQALKVALEPSVQDSD